MQGDGQPGVRRRLPDRVVDRVVEGPPVHRRVGPHEDRDHAGQVGHPADLCRDPGDVVGLVHRRNSTGPEQPALALLHVVGAPVVVGPGLGLGEIDVPLALQPEQHGRVQHRQVDVVLVHVLQARLGVPRRRPGLGVAHLAAEGPSPVLVARPGDTGRRQPVGGCAVPVVDQPLLARFVGLDVPDPIPILRRGVIGHRRRMLEDVPIRVDIAQPVVGKHRFPPLERSDSCRDLQNTLLSRRLHGRIRKRDGSGFGAVRGRHCRPLLGSARGAQRADSRAPPGHSPAVQQGTG